MTRFSHTLLFTLLFAAAVPAHAATVVPLNDTGQTLCYDNAGATVSCATVADDGHYGRDAANTAGTLTKTGAGTAGFDFSKIANNGTTLAAGAALGTAATDWACTRDNVTGLIWEVKTTSGLRSNVNSYSWYSTDATTNGGSAGTANGGVCTGSNCDTQSFVAAVNATSLCGYSDWRMPNLRELQSLLDFSKPGTGTPPLDTTYFPDTLSTNNWFWSANSLTTLGYVWVVGIGNIGSGSDPGTTSNYPKAGSVYVRLVRGVQ